MVYFTVQQTTGGILNVYSVKARNSKEAKIAAVAKGANVDKPMKAQKW